MNSRRGEEKQEHHEKTTKRKRIWLAPRGYMMVPPPRTSSKKYKHQDTKEKERHCHVCVGRLTYNTQVGDEDNGEVWRIIRHAGFFSFFFPFSFSGRHRRTEKQGTARDISWFVSIINAASGPLLSSSLNRFSSKYHPSGIS